MFGMVIETGPEFYVVPFPAQKVTDTEFLARLNNVHGELLYFPRHRR